MNQNWRAGSQCRAMYSEDGLVYPAVVLWVKGQRCRVRFNDYNNEEEQDISSLLSLDELHGPSKATAAKVKTWTQNWVSDPGLGIIMNRVAVFLLFTSNDSLTHVT